MKHSQSLLERLLPRTRLRGFFARSAVRAVLLVLLASVIRVSSATANTTSDPNAVPSEPSLPERLDLDEALRIFRARGLDVLVAEANVRSAAGDARAAHALNNPSLSIGVGRALTNCDGCSAPAFSATLSDQNAITDALFGKHALRGDVADAALEAAKLDKKDAQRLLETNLKQQYLAVVMAQAELDLGHEAREAAGKTIELVRRRVTAGAAAETDSLRAETDGLQLEDQNDAAALTLEKSKLDLAFLLGVRSSVPKFEVDDTLLKVAAHSPFDTLDKAALLREALTRRSDVLSAEYGERRAHAAAALARRTRWPDIALWVNYAMQGSGPNAPTPPTLTVGIDTPLPIFYQNQGEIGKAEADIYAQRVRRAKVDSQVVNDVESALSALEIARRRVARMGGTLLDSARRSRALTALQYERGAASLLEMLDAQRTFLSINAAYLQSVADYWNAVFTVEQATGRTLH